MSLKLVIHLATCNLLLDNNNLSHNYSERLLADEMMLPVGKSIVTNSHSIIRYYINISNESSRITWPFSDMIW